MKNYEKELIQKALNYKPYTDVFGLSICKSEGDTSKKDIYIDDKYFSNSTLDIWQTKGFDCADTMQYIKYKKFVLEFQIAFACFTNPNIDLYHYTFKRCV